MSASFDSGVRGYVIGEARIMNFFPIDEKGVAHINCQQCEFFNRHSGICNLNKQVVEFPQKYVGKDCPFELTDKKDFNHIGKELKEEC